MKKVILAICLLLFACEHKEEPKMHYEAPRPPPAAPPVIPTSTNPFEKPPPPPAHQPFQNPKWVQVGEFKMNDNWSIWTWRDEANHNTCYITNIISGGALHGHSISCVKE